MILLIRKFINERSARINGLCGKRGRMLGWREGMLWCEGAPPAQHRMFLALSGLGQGLWDNLGPSLEPPAHVELGAVTSGVSCLHSCTL